MHISQKGQQGQKLNGPKMLIKTSYLGTDPPRFAMFSLFFFIYLIQLLFFLINFLNLIIFHKTQKQHKIRKDKNKYFI